jgi:hypothetical protein
MKEIGSSKKKSVVRLSQKQSVVSGISLNQNSLINNAEESSEFGRLKKGIEDNNQEMQSL